MVRYENGVRIVTTGDIHINLRKYPEFERDRLLKYSEVLCEAAEGFYDPKEVHTSILILNGDIFDRAKPTYEEVGLFYEFLELLEWAYDDIYLISGNHEELSSDKTIYSYLPEYIYKYVKVGSIEIGDDLTVWLVGHPYLDYIYKTQPKNVRNILISHYRSGLDIAEDEVDNDYVEKTYDRAILSDIHYKLSPKPNIMYTSSPYSINFVKDKEYYGFDILVVDDEGEITHYSPVIELPSKYKLIYSGDSSVLSLKEFLKDNISPQNLYKLELLVPHSSLLEEVISSYDNIVSYKFVQDFSELSDEELNSIVDEIAERGEIHIKETLKRLLANREVDEEILKVGEEELKEL